MRDDLKRETTINGVTRTDKEIAQGFPASPCSPDVLEKLTELNKAIRFVRHDLEDAHYIRATHSIEGVQLRFNELEEAISGANSQVLTSSSKRDRE